MAAREPSQGSLVCVEWDLENLHLFNRDTLCARLKSDEAASFAGDLGVAPEFFFHLAWKGVNGAGRRDVAIQNANVLWAVDAVRVAAALGCRRFIDAGSIMEREVHYEATAPGLRPAPPSIYSAAKLSSHMMAETVAAELGIDFAWAMVTNAYGVGDPRFLTT